MNLRHQTEQTENTENTEPTNRTRGGETPKQGMAWYVQTETTQPLPVAAEPQPAPAAALFEPSAAERILARAGALQEVQGQMLSREQIEAVAAEIGIKPEFVRLAIEQEMAAAVLPPRYAVAAAKERQLFANARAAVIASLGISLAYGVLANALFSDLSYSIDQSAALWWLACVFPALLAFMYGVLGRSRRVGAAAGALLGATTTAALLFNFGIIGHNITLGIAELLVVVAMIAGGVFLGAAGAQARRVVSRRLVANRSGKSGRPVRRQRVP